jgi:flagellar biosynthesis protein FliR
VTSPFKLLWGIFFVLDIVAKALSLFAHLIQTQWEVLRKFLKEIGV